MTTLICRTTCCFCGALFLLTACAAPALVADRQTAESDKKADNRFSIEGTLEAELAVDWNFDIDDDDTAIVQLEPVFEIGTSYEFSKDVKAAFGFKYGRQLEYEYDDEQDDESGTRSYESSLELEELNVEIEDFFEIDDVLEKTSLTVGRFSASDKREWFYDADVDGVWLSFEVDPIDTEFGFSVNKEEIIGSDLLRHDDTDTVSNIIFTAEHKPFRDSNVQFDFYSIWRNDSSDDNESPRLHGLRSTGGFADRRFTYWADFALARGEDGDKDIEGYGFDVGSTLFFHNRLFPYITIGYAYGSGDGDVDTDFRQTDLQGNTDRFGGEPSLKYYGELLDPELSNLHIYTAGLGFRLGPDASIDFVYHHYVQDVALDELRSADIDRDPTGDDRHIGNELDVVLGFSVTPNIDAEVVLGYFQPGSAFEEDEQEPAILLDAKLSYDF